MKVISELINWAVLAVIVAATAFSEPLAIRFLGAVGVWVGIMNAVAVILTLSLLASADFQKKHREAQKKRSRLDIAYGWLSFSIGIAVYAYAGWLWTFGIGVVYQMTAKSVANTEAKELT